MLKYFLTINGVFLLFYRVKKEVFIMKARSFKKFFVSIALSAILTFSSTAAVFAATAQLSLAEQSANSIQE